MRSKKHLLGLLAMAAAFSENSIYEDEFREKTPEEKKEELERKKQVAEIRNNKRKGLTEYYFNNGLNSLWALNEKSANKKAKKKGWL